MQSEYSPEIQSIMKQKPHWLLSWGNGLLMIVVSFATVVGFWIPFADQISGPLQFRYSEEHQQWIGWMTISTENQNEIDAGLEVSIEDWDTSGVIVRVSHLESESKQTSYIEILMDTSFPNEMGGKIGIAQIRTNKRSLAKRWFKG